MTATLDDIALPLFVPADRPERFGKAFSAGADAAIIDLEDAVPADRKAEARQALLAAADAIGAASCPVVVRINAAETPWHADDLAAAAALPLAGIMLPKAESAATVSDAAARAGCAVLALVESARGIAAARAVAEAAARLAFGSIDLAADLGCAETREALLAFRSELVLASRLAGLAGPLDGVTASYRDATAIEDDARYAAALGFGGKLLIHPVQIAPARVGFEPAPAAVGWAERVLAAGAAGRAVAVDGAMVDAPVLKRAEQILRRAAASRSGKT